MSLRDLCIAAGALAGWEAARWFHHRFLSPGGARTPADPLTRRTEDAALTAPKAGDKL